jgi:class 3 adenylate cyclase/tetratricopeptide (TPR) repeat protein
LKVNPEQIDASIRALESQRALLGDAAVDTAIRTLRAQSEAAAPSSAEAELKQATVLFLDVVGSTKLSQHLDPEALRAGLDPFLARSTEVVVRHGGRVLQYAGDSVLAVFGAGRAREDDAERAVRAGLDLRELGASFSTRVFELHGHEGFGVRIGLHTGLVLLDADDRSIRGSAVHIAARMEQTAPAGAVQISDATYAHVRGVFNVAANPPLQLKGWEEPVLTYLVIQPKPRAFRVRSRGIEGVETRMIGRDDEMRRLEQCFLSWYGSDRQVVSVGVVAEAGAGKSRLLYELGNWAESRPEPFMLFQGRATPATQSLPFGLLRDVIAWRLEIADTDSMEEARRKLEVAVASLFLADVSDADARAEAHLLGQLIGLDFANSPHVAAIKDDRRQIRDRGFHAAAQLFRRLQARERIPLVFFLDDVHWADEGSLSFLDHLVDVNADVPMFIVAMTRPSLFESDGPRALAWFGRSLRLELASLGDQASRDLVAELLKKLSEVPPLLQELLVARADGNPFYMEELIRMLIDSGAIRVDADRWTLVAQTLLGLEVPRTLAGVLQARLDTLPPGERRALQVASVLGVTFSDKALASIDEAAYAALPALSKRHLVTLRDAAPEPSGEENIGEAHEYAFTHHFLQQVTYETVLKGRRREAHAGAARWFARQTGARANGLLGIAAAHFEQAGEAGSACEYFARAAEAAAGAFAHEAVLNYTQRALALAAADDLALRWRLLVNRESTLELQGRRDEQLADIIALADLAERLDDNESRAEAAYRRSSLALRTGDYPTTEREAQRAIACAETAGADQLAMRAQVRLVAALANQGRLEESRALAQQGLEHARAMGLPMLEAYFANGLGICADLSGDLAGVLQTSSHVLALTRKIGNRRMESVAVANVGLWHLKLGDLDQSRRFLEEGLRLNRLLGIREMEGHVLCSLSELALIEGEASAALRHAREALDISVKVRSRPNQSSALAVLANAEMACGKWQDAATAFAQMEALSREIAFSAGIIEAMEGTVRLALRQQKIGEAKIALERMLSTAREIAGDNREDPFAGGLENQIRLTIYQVWKAADDPRAAAALEDAHHKLQGRAAAIHNDALRRSYLDKVKENREIQALWAEAVRRKNTSQARAD